MPRIWLSTPIGGGRRVGVSVNPKEMYTRKLTTREMLSPTGRKVGMFVFAPLFGGAMLYWMVSTEGHWNETWIEMLIVYLVGIWSIRKILLSLFPRNFDEEKPQEAGEESPRLNGFGEPLH